MTPTVSYSINQRIGTILIESPPVNALSHNVRNGILEGLRMAATDDTEIVILRCKGRTFIAGADIIEATRAELAITPKEISDDEIIDRLALSAGQ